MNRLADETSPYLRQHRENPVDWYAWGSEAFEAARERGVPVLLSVGYSACHWCHVMAHECFEDDEVASMMNARFVNIKVDREERPDVDSVYMDAVQAMTGRGGWPMTVFMTADGRPFYGGTYFPKPSFLKLMDAIDDVWHNRRDEVDTNASALVKAIGTSAAIRPAGDVPGIDAVNGALKQIVGSFDAEWGGFGQAPKFPSTMHIELVLRAFMSSGSEDASTVVTTSLDAMASGGMYDHIGGGFARYSVDREWLVPHFEKMLYDQALLARVYLHGLAVLGHPRWLQVVDETISYVLRDLRHADGGFYSAEDADSPDEHGHGHEGLFHTWTPDEVRAVLAPEISTAGRCRARVVRHHRGGQLRGTVDPEPPGRARSARTDTRDRGGPATPVRCQGATATPTARRQGDHGMERAVPRHPGGGGGDARASRLAPGRDRQRRVLAPRAPPAGRSVAPQLAGRRRAAGSPRRARRRSRGAHRCVHPVGRGHRGRRVGSTPPARRPTSCSTTSGTSITAACSRPPTTANSSSPARRTSSTTPRLRPTRPPPTRSTRLAALTGEMRYANQADRIFQLLGTVIRQAPGGVSNALLGIETRSHGVTEVAIVGDRPDLVRITQSLFRPDIVLAWGERYDSPLWHERTDGLAYVCRDYACEAPQDTAEGFFRQLTGHELPAGLTNRQGG